MTLYSHSRLSTFEQCAFKYKLKYVDKIKPESFQSIEAFMGSLVHETLEKVYTDKKFQKVLSLEDAKAYLRSLWKKNWNDEIIIVRKGYEPNNYLDMALSFIEGYYKNFYPFDDGITVGLEERVVINLDPDGNYQLQGYIDRLATIGSEYHIIDYKTNSHLKIQDQIDSDRQLALYQIAVHNNYKDAKKVVLKWHFLAFGKVLISERSPEQLERLKKETIELIKTIESANEFKTKVSALCDWCEFRNMCPEWSHAFSLEGKSVNEYLSDDGVKLVNEFIKASDDVKELSAKLDKIKEALVAFSKKKGVNVVFGSNNKVKVTTYPSLHFPKKGSPDRFELVKLLKNSGDWEFVEDLDTYELAKMINNAELNESVIKAIAHFITRDETSRLYPSKINRDEDLTK